MTRQDWPSIIKITRYHFDTKNEIDLKQKSGYSLVFSSTEDRSLKVFIVREVGNVSRLEDLVWKVTSQKENNVEVTAAPLKHAGIAHTRWATHGEVYTHIHT
jgi:hypothetical protein